MKIRNFFTHALNQVFYQPLTTDRDSLFINIKNTLEQKPQGGEATAYSRRHILVHLANEASNVKYPLNDHDLHLVARLFTELKIWDRAHYYWTTLSHRESDSKAIALAQAAIASAHLGHFSDSFAFLAKSKKAELPSASLQHAQNTINNLFNIYLTNNLGKKIIPIANTNLKKAGHIWKGAAAIINHHSSAIEGVDSIIRAIRDAQDDRLGYRPTSSLSASHPSPSKRMIFSSGLMYSGSGAFSDFLRSYKVPFPFGQRELSFFPLQRSLLTRTNRADKNIYARTLLSYICRTVYGISTNQSAATDYNLRNRSLLLESDADTAQHIIDQLVVFIHNILPSNLDKDESIRACIRSLNSEIMSLVSRSSSISAINNSIQAYDIDLASLIPNSIFVIVTRDPRDQIMDRLIKRQKSIDNSTFIGQVVNYQKKALPKINDKIARQKKNCSIECVRFEDFIEHAHVRTKLAETLGISSRETDSKRLFFPNLSAQNIGIHRDYHDQSMMRWVEDELAPLQIQPTITP